MTEIKVKHVVSCNSEERGYPADNILDTDPAKKWKCAAGEKNGTILVQLEKSSEITSVDIGNENSAFIEILVGKESEKSEDFQVLLPATGFMTPTESRSLSNGSKVRMFKKEDLSSKALHGKWDRVRIVCSQPFNKFIGYGISFLRLQGPQGEADPVEPPSLKKEQKTISLGKFKLRVEVDEDDPPAPGSLFSRRHTSQHKEKEEVGSSPASAIRTASRVQDIVGMSAVDEVEAKKTPTPFSEKGSSVKRESSIPSQKGSGSGDSDPGPSSKRIKVSASSKNEPRKKKAVKVVPLGELMEGVVFVISGIQNPERAEIREDGLEMGAKYRSDWGRDCTHLICAFPNTPKYNQVKGKGKIVRKEWLRDSRRQKKRLSWRKYAFEKKDIEGSDSEAEETIVGDPQLNDFTPKTSPVLDEPKKEAEQNGAVSSSASSQHKRNDPEEVYNISTDQAPSSDEEGRNTDEEVERVRARQKKKKLVKKSPAKLDVGPDGLPLLPSFFAGHKFLLYGELSSQTRKQLRRFITAFNGKIEEYMADSVTHVVTASRWNEDFDEALKENEKLIFVKPAWVTECGRLSQLLSLEDYLVEK